MLADDMYSVFIPRSNDNHDKNARQWQRNRSVVMFTVKLNDVTGRFIMICSLRCSCWEMKEEGTEIYPGTRCLFLSQISSLKEFSQEGHKGPCLITFTCLKNTRLTFGKKHPVISIETNWKWVCIPQGCKKAGEILYCKL